LGRTIFDLDFQSLQNKNPEDLVAYNSLFNILLNPRRIIREMICYNLNPFHKNDTMENSIDHLNKLMLKMMDKSLIKMKNGDKPNSMVDYLMLEKMNGELTEDVVKSNLFIFFVAGHETTATTLTCLIQSLADKPELQEKMRNEVLQELKDEDPSYENTKKLDFMAAAIKENLRLFGPVSVLTRVAEKDTEVEGVVIKKGVEICLSIDGVNRSKEIYKDPEEFKPERWLNNEVGSSYNWIPFGSGSRICVGNHFSLLEQKIFMSLLVKKFKWEFVDKNQKIQIDNGLLRGVTPKNILFTKIN